jgi:hypothetical protein
VTVVKCESDGYVAAGGCVVGLDFIDQAVQIGCFDGNSEIHPMRSCKCPPPVDDLWMVMHESYPPTLNHNKKIPYRF